MTSRSTPFAELEQFFERMSDQFDEAARTWDADSPFGRLSSGFGTMAVDLVDRDEEFEVTVDMPGFEREEVEVRITDHTLRIEAEHDEAVEEAEEGRYLRHERRHESVDRSIRLPGEVDTDGVDARMKNGVLTITLPKLEAEKAREIEIE